MVLGRADTRDQREARKGLARNSDQVTISPNFHRWGRKEFWELGNFAKVPQLLGGRPGIPLQHA